ncbi:nucleotide sugar dehydrogenase [Uliginosibacterium aquaticum]|uniref:Nucleotide sugar dehydrogenase n=1 Tax=Uliginosibacterium aquaticum TaxID=2731212 RepID=A0ABX2IDN5_9RHOO|nr:nucleotide sugar dehydrogenase [Uliginosibacterium aquaticum]NSL54709.1 nucleotide sugar dehydrogenase [Uliginosibacterium aquaticum]
MTLRIAVVGLGYVGLPLAVEFGKRYPVVGFDISARLIRDYANGIDPHGNLTPDALAGATRLSFSCAPQALREADVYIIAVPTPVNIAHQPDFGPLIAASQTVGSVLRRGAIVVYESTVYPGATEEVCVPELERASGLSWPEDFHVGYSPERINPGDAVHALTEVIKIVSGDSPETLARIAALYESILPKGVYRASSIKVAEAAKVIENTQRDLNIALMNELAIIFHQASIDTAEVLDAAGTKWNFLPFRPGLVGGHCIGVDPYYLTYKAETLGYFPEVILAGRRINDHMGKFVAEQTVKNIIQAGFPVHDAVVSVLGLSFKENCPDLRNTRVLDIIKELRSYGIRVQVHDPVACAEEALDEYGVELVPWQSLRASQGLILAVAHSALLDRPLADYRTKLVPGGVFVDVKSSFNAATLRSLGYRVWRL